MEITGGGGVGGLSRSGSPRGEERRIEPEPEKMRANFLRLPLRAGRRLADQLLNAALELAPLQKEMLC